MRQVKKWRAIAGKYHGPIVIDADELRSILDAIDSLQELCTRACAEWKWVTTMHMGPDVRNEELVRIAAVLREMPE